MVGQVAQGVLVADGLVADHQFVVVGECVGDHHLQIAGVILLAVGRGGLENQHVLADALDGGRFPELLVEADKAKEFFADKK